MGRGNNRIVCKAKIRVWFVQGGRGNLLGGNRHTMEASLSCESPPGLHLQSPASFSRKGMGKHGERHGMPFANEVRRTSIHSEDPTDVGQDVRNKNKHWGCCKSNVEGQPGRHGEGRNSWLTTTAMCAPCWIGYGGRS